MSVLINGMEMPKDCGHCRFAVDGWCYAYGRANIEALATYDRTNFCPLAPIPPHGRLIDADVALKSEQPPNCPDELWAETTFEPKPNTMKCVECPYFKITQHPIKGWDFGLAECTKYNLIVDFANNRKLNRLECTKAEGDG